MAKYFDPKRNLSITSKLLSRQLQTVWSTAGYEHVGADDAHKAHIHAITEKLRTLNLFVPDSTVLDEVTALLNPYTETDDFDNEVWILRSLHEDYLFWIAQSAQ